MSLAVLTSLSPAPAAVDRQTMCLQSWRRCGLEPATVNHASEVHAVEGYGLRVLPASRTGLPRYGRHVVPINEFVDLITRWGAPALILNADIELRATPWQIEHLTELAAAGVPVIARVNHDADGGNAMVEPAGFDGFVLSPRHCHLYAESVLSLGQPWWDYWIPWMVRQAGEPLYLPREPLAYHLRHSSAWGRQPWDAGAVELARLVELDAGADHDAHSRLSATVYDAISRYATRVDL